MKLKRFRIRLYALISTLFLGVVGPLSGNAFAASAVNCGQTSSSFLGFPTWYKYLNPQFSDGQCNLSINFPQDIPKIGLALVEIALRVGGMVAVAFVIYGGFRYILSQGSSDQAASARHTIINALIGLVIAVLATLIVSFIAGSLT
jgi:hypothetical protein